jgi:hypothetical protein
MIAKAGTSKGLGDEDTHQAKGTHFFENILGEMLGLIPVHDVGLDFLFAKAGYHIGHHGFILFYLNSHDKLGLMLFTKIINV